MRDYDLAKSRRYPFKPVTMASLRDNNLVLEIHCCGCGRFVELDAKVTAVR